MWKNNENSCFHEKDMSKNIDLNFLKPKLRQFFFGFYGHIG